MSEINNNAKRKTNLYVNYSNLIKLMSIDLSGCW